MNILIQQTWSIFMHKNNQEAYFCRVCGLEQLTKPWGDDEMTPSFEICDCCGVEFGYEDCKPESVLKYRKRWVEQKNKWFNPKEMPADWSLEKQMDNIPLPYR